MLNEKIAVFLNDIRKKNLFREPKVYENACGTELIFQNKVYQNFASNNYLNLAESDRLKDASIQATKKWGASASASRLITGTLALTEELEYRVAQFKGKPEGLVFNSGYTANLGTLQALNFCKPLFLVDKFAHASIIDGLQFANASFKRFKHNDYIHLEKLIKAHSEEEIIWVVVDSVYSMDGDVADLETLITLKKRYPNVYLYVDEAHATGIQGKTGKGLTEGFSEIDVIMGTFSKGLGSYGAFLALSSELKTLVQNISRPFIYTTALSPGVLGANIEALKCIEDHPEWGVELLKKSQKFLKELNRLGYNTMNSSTQIIPIVMDTNERAIQLADYLKQEGVWTLPIRTPTVPVNTSRVRITLQRKSTGLDRLLELLTEFEIR